MPKISSEKLKKTGALLARKKVFTFDLLIKELDCSTRTGRAKIKQWKAYTSYNKNGSYYAMPSVPRFDNNGLWRYKDIYFSKQGTLKNTVVHLVGRSESGLSANEIGRIVGLSPQSFMHHFRSAEGIRREKHAGVYVYFSTDEDKYNRQLQKRISGSLSDSDAILILVELIKHPGLTIEQLALRPQIKQMNIKDAAISQFLERCGLLKKLRL